MLIKFNFSYYKYDYYNNDMEFHRLDGPAFKDKNGNKYWRKNNYQHREDGPAIEYSDGGRWFYLNDERYTEKEYWQIIKFKGFL